MGACLTLRNELSQKTLMLTVQEILSGRGTWAECRRVREPRRIALPHGSQSRVYGDGVHFWVFSGRSF